MKLLILTQKVDTNDPILGFFHQWIVDIATHCEKVSVVCLQKGAYHLPPNVVVYSLGKEAGKSRLQKVFRFFRYIFSLRNEYDSVFVHMNQEYVVLGGVFWKLWHKRIFMWRNHPLGSIWTRLAVWFCDHVFYTSPFSFTARFKKTVRMPVGIDTELFNVKNESRLTHSVLFLGRIERIKKPEVVIEGLALALKKSPDIQCAFVGPLSDPAYGVALHDLIAERKLGSVVAFEEAIPNRMVPAVLNRYEVYINTTPTGSMDKTIFEAMASGMLPLVSNKALVGEIPSQFIFEEGNAVDLSEKLLALFALPSLKKEEYRRLLRSYVIEHHSLNVLMQKLRVFLLP